MGVQPVAVCVTGGQVVGEMPGDQPFGDRVVDEAEDPVVGADEQAAGADGVGDLFCRQVPAGEIGERAGQILDLLDPDQRLAALPQPQRQRGDRLEEVRGGQADRYPRMSWVRSPS
ncbi:hypothetical protein GCM10027615_35990 [Plantactinospora veratri]